MSTLYKIADSITNALVSLESHDDGEIPAEAMQSLDALQMQFSEKADGICRFLRHCETQAAAVALEVERLKKMQERLDCKADWLKFYLKSCMDATGQSKCSTELFTLTICKNSRPSIKVADGKPVPPEFQRVKIELDGTAAYDAWKAGRDLPPEIVVTQGNHLRIR